jgi:hypothetical protein
MEAAGDNTGGGGDAAGGAGGAGQGSNNSAPNGGGGLLSTGGAGNSGGDTGKGAAPAGDNAGGGDPSVKYPENWKLGLSKELQESGALKVIHDIPSLVKSYLHAQKSIGADKIVMPSKHATPEEWREVYHKLGLPEKMEDYKIAASKESGLDAKFVPAFAAKAHELGLMPAQAQEMINWMDGLNKTAVTESATAKANALKESVSGLQKEWGVAFNEKLAAAQGALAHFADKETIEHIEKTGLSNDVHLVKLFAKVADILKEDGLLKTDAAGTGLNTPAMAQEKLNIIQRDMSHPFYNKEHPNHAAAIKEVTALRQQSNPIRK